MFIGYASAGVRSLVIALDNRPCATGAQAETGRREVRRPVKLHVGGRFKAMLTIKHSVKGTHYACGYLVHSGSGASVARAGWHYVTR